MPFTILSASILDLRGLFRVEQACFQLDAWPLLDLVAVLTFTDVVRFKAMVAGRMVGFIAGDPRPSDQMAWIATLAVLPEFRHQGIASELLDSCEKGLKYDRIRLCVRPSNLPALELYRKSGYQEVDRWSNYYNDHGDALIMEKRLK